MGDPNTDDEISYKRSVAELLTVSILETAILVVFIIVLIYFAMQTIKKTRSGN
jgi:uncharacterized protein (UPF0333 family)